jgi:DNA-binding FadR family transcriptional regulator
MSQEELAHQVGGTRQSVNAALRGFERRGWIEVHDRTVTVKQAGRAGPVRRHRGVGKLTVQVSAARLTILHAVEEGLGQARE